MAKRRKPKPKPKRKQHASHRKHETLKGRELFLACLGKGLAPADAAAMAGVSRATVYNWKKEDQAFDARWIDAVETSLDHLETVLYQSAASGLEPSNLQFALKWRRRNTYNSPDGDKAQPTNFIMNITLQEQYKRLERLGLPVPVIESDYEVEDVAEDRERSSA
jgi:hypothetical protein